MRNDMLTPALRTNIERLKKVFYGSDPTCNGENPACEPIQDAITAEMDQWSDDRIKVFEASLNEDEEELLFSVFCELACTRAFLCQKYFNGWLPPGAIQKDLKD